MSESREVTPGDRDALRRIMDERAVADMDLPPLDRDAALAEAILAAGFRRVSPVTREALTEFMHTRNEFDYDECQHGTYSGGPSDGEPYAMCERQGSALFEFLSVSPPAEVEVTDDTAEQATLYGYQAVWDEAKFDADPVKNAWMWQRVQIAVKAAVARALGAVTPGEGKGK